MYNTANYLKFVGINVLGFWNKTLFMGINIHGSGIVNFLGARVIFAGLYISDLNIVANFTKETW